MGYEARFMVEWGDCDEAGIVYYPNYFYWIDCTFQRWLRSTGLSHRELRGEMGREVPLMDVGCNFRKPVRYDDELIIRAEIVEWKENRFRIEYEMFVGGERIGTGHELRAWARMLEDGRLKAAPIDPGFKARMGG